MREMRSLTLVITMSLMVAVAAPNALAAPEFVNGLTLDGGLLDRSGGTDANTGRVGYFSDIYYDPEGDAWESAPMLRRPIRRSFASISTARPT